MPNLSLLLDVIGNEYSCYTTEGSCLLIGCHRVGNRGGGGRWCPPGQAPPGVPRRADRVYSPSRSGREVLSGGPHRRRVLVRNASSSVGARNRLLRCSKLFGYNIHCRPRRGMRLRGCGSQGTTFPRRQRLCPGGGRVAVGVPTRSGGVKGFHHETLPVLARRPGNRIGPGLGVRVPTLLGSTAATVRPVWPTACVHASARVRSALCSGL
jgi:hypothetical protein